MPAWEIQFVTCARDDSGQWRVNSINDTVISSARQTESPAAFLVRSGADGWDLVSLQFVPSLTVTYQSPTQADDLSVLSGKPTPLGQEQHRHGGNIVLVLKRQSG